MKKLLLFLFGVLAFAGMRAQDSETWTEESLAQFDAELIADYTDVVYMKSCIFPKGSGVVDIPICIKAHSAFTTTEFDILLPEGLEPEWETGKLGDKKAIVVGTDRANEATMDLSYVERTGKWNMIAFTLDDYPVVDDNRFCFVKVDISDLDPGVYDLIVQENQTIAGFEDNPNGSTQYAG